MSRVLLRFLLLGGALFALQRWGSAPTAARDAATVASDEGVLLREAMARGLDRDDPVVARRLMQNMAFVEAEGGAREMQRQARNLGMAADDVVVRRRLIERMRATLAAELAEPTDDDLRAYLALHRDELASPEGMRLSQIFLGSDARAADRGRDLLALQGEEDPGLLSARDVGPWPRRLPAKTPAALARMFGPSFAERLRELPLGEWHGPVRSVYGLHLVRVEERTPSSLADFSLLRPRLRAALLAERREANLSEALTSRRTSAEGSR